MPETADPRERHLPATTATTATATASVPGPRTPWPDRAARPARAALPVPVEDEYGEPHIIRGTD